MSTDVKENENPKLERAEAQIRNITRGFMENWLESIGTALEQINMDGPVMDTSTAIEIGLDEIEDANIDGDLIKHVEKVRKHIRNPDTY